MKKTSLFDSHVKAGGKIIDFAGWQLPVEYSGILPEHHAVRNSAGLFDVSHMGEVDVKGPDAEAFVQNLVTNDVTKMKDNGVMYALMCYPHGGVVDDLLVYKRTSDDFLLVINAANVDKDFDWMKSQVGAFNVSLHNISDNVSEVAFQGPKAQEILQRLTTFDLESIAFFCFNENVEIAGAKCLVSRTGYTGEDGFEIYTSNDKIESVWNAILDAGKNDGALPAGLGCRDTLRFEAALPLYGQEISPEISPLEAGLGMFVKLESDDFIGRDVLVKQKSDGLSKKVIGFELLDRGIPRHGYPVQKDGVVIGHVTTGYMAPSVGKTIGLALVDIANSEMDSTFDVIIRNKPAQAKVISKKFLVKKYKK